MKQVDSGRDRTPIVWNGRPSRQRVLESTDPASLPTLVLSSDPLMRTSVTFLAIIVGMVPFTLFFATRTATVPWAWLYYFPIAALVILLVWIVAWFLWGTTVLRLLPNTLRVELRLGPLVVRRNVPRDPIERLLIRREKNRVLFAGTGEKARVVLFARAEVILVAAKWLSHQLQVPVDHEEGQAAPDFEPDEEWRPLPVPDASWGTPRRVWVRSTDDGMEIGRESGQETSSPLQMLIVLSMAAVVMALFFALSQIVLYWDFAMVWPAFKVGLIGVPPAVVFGSLLALTQVFSKIRLPVPIVSVTDTEIRFSSVEKPVKRSRADCIQLCESGNGLLSSWCCSQDDLVTVSILGKGKRLAEIFPCHPNSALLIADQLSQATGLPIVYEDSERRTSEPHPFPEDHGK